MIKIGVSRKIPTAAISVDRTMKIMKLAVRVVDSEASSSTCSHTTALAGSPGAARSAVSAARDSSASSCSIAIDPCSETPSS